MKKLIAILKDPKIIRRIVAIAAIVLIVFTFYFYQITQGRVKIDNSQLSAPIINIAPTAPGKLVELDATEGHSVKTGDVLAIVSTETIRAQNDGLIVMANDQVGGNVSPTQPLIQMIKTQDLRVAGTIDENKGLNQIKVGQTVAFTVDALPGKTFWGYVDEIAPTAKQTQLAFSISSERPTQQFQIFAKFDSNSNPEIKNGMSAKMTVFTKSI